jgi:two-component system LytT family response regulator
VTARLRVLLVDDERLARAELRRLLQAHPDIDIVGEAVDAADGLRQIAALEPDLVFLDVQMPGGSGFDLLAALDAAPDVIFTTAYDRYALQAFEVNALDYLQKPVQAARLAAALDRHAQRRGRGPARPPTTDRKLFLRDGERCWFVALRDVRFLSAEGNYTRVHFDAHRPLVLRSLKQFEETLDPQCFFRASRSHIVNLEHVQRVTPNEAGGFDLQLSGGDMVDVARRRAAEFRQLASL